MMEAIRTNQVIRVPEGHSRYIIESERDLEIDLQFDFSCNVYIEIRKCGKLRIRSFVNRNVEAAVLFWNVSEAKLVTDESHEVMQNASFTAAYGECNAADTERTIFTALREEGAKALISSASLVSKNKKYHVNVANFAPHTDGEIKNYAVVLKDGSLMIDAIGKIVHGAYRSESHQTSRALSFEDGQRTTILPELLIDENDVQASHAMSIGRMDEDQLYYMMSRGLDMKQCTMLVSLGYLLPIADTIPDGDLQKELKDQLERKIVELCSM